MLNKDQYNQDEYNDYYAQETRGAEISQGGEEGSNKKIAFIFLLLLLIIAVGYFGWKNMNSSTPDSTKVAAQTELTEEKVAPKEADSSPKEVASQADKIAKQVQSIASSDDANGKMNPEDIANIVQMVMMQMNQEKSQAPSSSAKQSTASSEDELQDSKLMESLSGTEVDSLSSVSDNVDSISQSDNTKSASSSATPNTYNKVVLADNTADNSNDALSQLSDEISSVIDSEEATPSSNNTYTQSITKEVKTRTREMRYIVVKKGDTLGKIAKRAYGNAMSYKKIYEANPDILRRPDRIYIGQKLRIP